jgi:hypothetical protein
VAANETTVGNLFHWQDEYGPGDVGMTFIASAEIVNGANRAIATLDTRYLLQTGPANFSTATNLFAPHCEFNDCVRVLVANFDLPAHTITSVERIIDELNLTRGQGDFYLLEAAQRIRFWGEPVPPLSGDFNRNGSVDGADYVLWRDLQGQPVAIPNESGLNPGSVDIEDYWFWRANFGKSADVIPEAIATTAIPEPAALALAFIAFVAKALIR